MDNGDTVDPITGTGVLSAGTATPSLRDIPEAPTGELYNEKGLPNADGRVFISNGNWVFSQLNQVSGNQFLLH